MFGVGAVGYLGGAPDLFARRAFSSTGVLIGDASARLESISMHIVAFCFGQIWLAIALVLFVTRHVASSYYLAGTNWIEPKYYSAAWAAAVVIALANFVWAAVLGRRKQSD